MNHHRWARLSAPDGDDVTVALPSHFDALAETILRGTYAPSPPARLVFDLLSPGSVLLDLGANLGVVTLVAARLGAGVVAVEAAPGNAACLRASCRANGFSNLDVVEAAVSDASGVVLFHENGAYGQVTSEAGPGVVEVRAATVSEILRDRHLERVDVVKMDVEGHEPEAIFGMRELLEPVGAPPVVFESNRHTLHRAGTTPTDLIALFEGFGYRTYLVGEGELTEASSSSFQVETVSDYLATKGTTPARWAVRPPLTLDETAERIGVEARHPLGHSRAAIARALAGADPALRSRDDVAATIEELALDPDWEVAEAARVPPDAAPIEASGSAAGIAQPLRRATETLRSISRQAAALGEVVSRGLRKAGARR